MQNSFCNALNKKRKVKKLKVRDILKISALNLQNEEILAYLNGKTVDEETEKEVDKLLSCYKLIISELCEEYLAVKKAETFSTTDGVINYGKFSKVPLEIKSCYEGEREVDFTVTPLHLKTESGSVTVVYEYYPEIISLDDDCPYTGTRISERIIAMGVCREYLLISGLFDEAVVFDERYQKALSIVLFPKNLKKIKVRGWY